DNASRYQHDHSTALHLQSAMLTEVPASPGLDSAALYRPAVSRDLVGGDWYDSFPIPAGPGRPDQDTSLAIAIGDVGSRRGRWISNRRAGNYRPAIAAWYCS